MSKKKYEKYLQDFLKEYPKISSGRKNYYLFKERIIKQVNLIKKFIKNKK